jgi:hypothetical protein
MANRKRKTSPEEWARWRENERLPVDAINERLGADAVREGVPFEPFVPGAPENHERGRRLYERGAGRRPADGLEPA